MCGARPPRGPSPSAVRFIAQPADSDKKCAGRECGRFWIVRTGPENSIRSAAALAPEPTQCFWLRSIFPESIFRSPLFFLWTLFEIGPAEIGILGINH